jgi:protein-S-isoprenylcysteine O-methyltransferase Ste14
MGLIERGAAERRTDTPGRCFGMLGLLVSFARDGGVAVNAEGMSGARSKQGGALVRVPPPLVFLGLIAIGVVVHFFVHRLPVGLPLLPRLILGAALLLGGIVVGLGSIRLFQRSGRPNPLPWHPSPTLVAEGFYRFTRNPMYLSEVIQIIGIGLVLDSAWVVLLAPVFLCIVHVTAVLPEERYLAETFGESYQRYCASVRRYF